MNVIDPASKRGRLTAAIASVLFAAAFLSANVPGEPQVGSDIMGDGKYGPHFETYVQSVEHGWPFAVVSHGGCFSWETPGLPSPWSIGENVRFVLPALVANILLLVVGAAALFWFVSRHVRIHGWRFRVVHLLATFIILSFGMTLFAYRFRLHREQVQFLQRQKIDVVEWEPFGPYWLRSITGPKMWEWGDHIYSVGLNHSEEISGLPGRDQVKVLQIFTVSVDSMPSLAEYGELIAIDLCWINHDYGGLDGGDASEFWRPVAEVAKCESLQGLNLWDAGVTDRGLRELSRMPNLLNLELSCNEITDEGLNHVASIKSLRQLRLWGTNVTTDGVNRLQARLPGCHIEH